jgi:hypothetical protein
LYKTRILFLKNWHVTLWNVLCYVPRWSIDAMELASSTLPRPHPLFYDLEDDLHKHLWFEAHFRCWPRKTRFFSAVKMHSLLSCWKFLVVQLLSSN